MIKKHLLKEYRVLTRQGNIGIGPHHELMLKSHVVGSFMGLNERRTLEKDIGVEWKLTDHNNIWFSPGKKLQHEQKHQRKDPKHQEKKGELYTYLYKWCYGLGRLMGMGQSQSEEVGEDKLGLRQTGLQFSEMYNKLRYSRKLPIISIPVYYLVVILANYWT